MMNTQQSTTYSKPENNTMTNPTNAMNTIPTTTEDNTMLKSFQEHMLTGVSAAKAASLVQGEVMASQRKEAWEHMQQISLNVVFHAVNKDKSGVMKTIHAGAKALDETSNLTNAKLAALAAGMTHKEFVWTAPVVSSWTQAVVVGDKTNMNTELKGQKNKQYEGFSEERLVNFLMSRQKHQWVFAATAGLMAPIYELLDKGQAAGLLKTNKTMDEYGRPSWSWVMKNLGYLNFMDALYQRELKGGDEAFKSNKISRLEHQVEMDYADKAAVIGDHYAEQRVNELVEAKAALKTQQLQSKLWKELLPHMQTFNAVQAWAESDFQINIDTPELGKFQEELAKATVDRIASALEQSLAFIANAETQKAKAVEKLAEISKNRPSLVAELA